MYRRTFGAGTGDAATSSETSMLDATAGVAASVGTLIATLTKSRFWHCKQSLIGTRKGSEPC